MQEGCETCKGVMKCLESALGTWTLRDASVTNNSIDMKLSDRRLDTGETMLPNRLSII